ncbi:inorganic diphosphatase [Ureaplasma canigenitalium]|uniref:inorganic diphosphatase n=1 Tax=Ureaplasma canigenitalium TaxID=42092 RepID=UPI0004E0F0F9|nr:inorganic diphosphatase [Ureaplasma canigenitalium]
MKINVTIEIPKHSAIKYEYDRKTGDIIVDRVLYGSMVYPQNYGFIKDALDYDGDELDVLVISNHSLIPGSRVKARLVGALEMIDNNETDTKLLAVIDVDPRFDFIKDLEDVPPHLLLEIKDFFENYKNLQKKKVEVRNFKNQEWAINELEECKILMQKYGNMDKDEFVALMKKEHPSKYTI